MNLGVQYYRAPFPNRRYWADDFAKIRDSGLDTVQLWVLWGWVESKPAEFVYDDYDELVALAGLKLLVLPRAIVLDEKKEKALENWVRQGGTLLCESETGAFDPTGVYRYAGDRWLAKMTGATEIGRRRGTNLLLSVSVPGQGTHKLHIGQWQTPMAPVGKVWAKSKEGAMVQEVAVGKGRVILCGCNLGALPKEMKSRSLCPPLEAFVAARKVAWVLHPLSQSGPRQV